MQERTIFVVTAENYEDYIILGDFDDQQMAEKFLLRYTNGKPPSPYLGGERIEQFLLNLATLEDARI